MLHSMGGGPIVSVVQDKAAKTYSAGLGIPFSKRSKVLRTANLDQVMKKEELNKNGLHRGSDKSCSVRGAMCF